MVFTLTEKNSQTVMSTSVSQYQAILFDAVEDFIPTSANSTPTGSMLNPVIIDVNNTAHKVSSSTLLDISCRMDEVKDYSESFGSKNIYVAWGKGCFATAGVYHSWEGKGQAKSVTNGVNYAQMIGYTTLD